MTSYLSDENISIDYEHSVTFEVFTLSKRDFRAQIFQSQFNHIKHIK